MAGSLEDITVMSLDITEGDDKKDKREDEMCFLAVLDEYSLAGNAEVLDDKREGADTQRRVLRETALVLAAIASLQSEIPSATQGVGCDEILDFGQRT